jgi:putative transposase
MPRRRCRSKKTLSPTHLKGLANSLRDDYKVSCKGASAVVMLHRSLWYYESKGRDGTVVRKRMHEIVQVRIRYCFWRIFILLRREGYRDMNLRSESYPEVQRVYRFYCEEGLNLRGKRPKRNRASAH